MVRLVQIQRFAVADHGEQRSNLLVPDGDRKVLAASEANPSLHKRKISPHTLRHTTEMHLLHFDAREEWSASAHEA